MQSQEMKEHIFCVVSSFGNNFRCIKVQLIFYCLDVYCLHSTKWIKFEWTTKWIKVVLQSIFYANFVLQ